ncbi:MAG: DUF4129 domain-containing protein [Anaerolineales bacterium]|nr:MAG: DUF4129 domain-containing protein [Anaerolineales bacterium]
MDIPWRKVGRWTFELLPVIGMVYAVSESLKLISWVPEDAAHTRTLILGLIVGLALARAQFRGFIAALYNLALSFLVSLEFAAGFLPSPTFIFVNAKAESILYMNNRLIFFFDQVLNWGASISSGEPIRERVIIIFFLSFLHWNFVAWLGWWTFRNRHVLVGALPLGFSLAVIVGRADQSMRYLQLYVLCALLALGSAYFFSRHRIWKDRGVDYPEGMGLEWGIGTTMIAAFVVFTSGIAPLVATPEGWADIREWLQRGEQKTAASSGFSGGLEPESTLTAHSLSPELQTIGKHPPTGQEVTMWVHISDPAPPPAEVLVPLSIPQHYWRSRIYTAYTGQGWEPLEEAVKQGEVGDSLDVPHGRYALEQTYTLDSEIIDVLYAVNKPFSIAFAGGGYDIAQEGIILADIDGQFEYSVLSWAASLTIRDLQHSPGSFPPFIAEIYLQLPEELPNRVRDLSGQLTHSLSTPYEKVKRIESYLRVNYPYDLDTPPPPQGRDAVDYFLFDAERGFCSYHASAMVIMLRSIGIPARVVSGYAMGSYDLEMEAYKVLERDAHAWVEVYFPENGWIEFEPTTNRRTFNRPESSASLEVQDEPGLLGDPLPDRPYFLPGLMIIAVVLMALGLIPFTRRKRVDRGRYRDYGMSGVVYLRMRQMLLSAGFHGNPATTPHEFLAQLEPQIGAHPTIVQILQEATDRYTEARFREKIPSAEDERAIDQMWRKNTWIWLTFMLKQRIRQVRSRLYSHEKKARHLSAPNP